MTRSAVRSRLAPPAFACFASYGSASHAEAYRSEASEGCRVVARRAKTGRPQIGSLPFASYGSAGHAEACRSEASEGCRVVARRAKTGRPQIGSLPFANYGSASHAEA